MAAKEHIRLRLGFGATSRTHPSSRRASVVALPKSYAGHDAGQEAEVDDADLMDKVDRLNSHTADAGRRSPSTHGRGLRGLDAQLVWAEGMLKTRGKSVNSQNRHLQAFHGAARRRKRKTACMQNQRTVEFPIGKKSIFPGSKSLFVPGREYYP